ncbi:MAG: hypothetical protein WCI89_01545 [bacterium]
MENESNESSEMARVIEQLELANQQLAKQNSFKRMFAVGIVYGIGFFVGSAILATIALGIIGPYVGKIGWVRQSFQTGSELKR